MAAGEPEDALQLFTQLARLEPQKVAHRLWIVEVERRLKNYEGARKTLEEITLEEVKDNAHALIQVALLRQQLDLGATCRSLTARGASTSTTQTSTTRTFNFFMDHTRRERGDLDVECVAVDFAVHLKDAKGEKKMYLIVEQEEYDLQQGEIADGPASRGNARQAHRRHGRLQPRES